MFTEKSSNTTVNASAAEQTSIASLKKEWTQKYTGEPFSVYKKKVDGFEVSFNPLRAHYMTSTQHAAIDTDVFCSKWEKISKNEKIGEVQLPHYTWLIATNTSPIEEFHSLLICSEHQGQVLTRNSIEDLHKFSQLYPEISVGFNGWKAGASQNHLHAQLLFSRLPIENWKKDEAGRVENYPGVCFSFGNTRDAYELVKNLELKKIPYNMLFSNRFLYVIPRKNENDDFNTKRGFDSVFGRIPMISQKDYDDVTEDTIRSILASLVFQALALD